jgi:hypothetical protein
MRKSRRRMLVIPIYFTNWSVKKPS